MTHRRALLVALAVALLFAAGYSMLAPQGARGWGSIEIVDISTGERDEESITIYYTLRFPGARFGVSYKFIVVITSAQCGVVADALSDTRRWYGQGELKERLTLSGGPVCAADDYEMSVTLANLHAQAVARDTMRFSVPSSP